MGMFSKPIRSEAMMRLAKMKAGNFIRKNADVATYSVGAGLIGGAYGAMGSNDDNALSHAAKGMVAGAVGGLGVRAFKNKLRIGMK